MQRTAREMVEVTRVKVPGRGAVRFEGSLAIRPGKKLAPRVSRGKFEFLGALGRGKRRAEEQMFSMTAGPTAWCATGLAIFVLGTARW
jgi:hypothetical protein